jgi:hypothetical protein
LRTNGATADLGKCKFAAERLRHLNDLIRASMFQRGDSIKEVYEGIKRPGVYRNFSFPTLSG